MTGTIKLKSDYANLLTSYMKYKDKCHELREELREVVDFDCYIVEELTKGFYLLIEDLSDRKAPLKDCLDVIEKKGRLSEEDFDELVGNEGD